MAFMFQARTAYGNPAGYFSDVPQASRTLTCYENDDTLTHTAAFIRSVMEVVWHPPNKNAGKISITGSVAVSKIKFWAVESNTLTSTGDLVSSVSSVRTQQSGNNETFENSGSDRSTENRATNGVFIMTDGGSSLVMILVSVIMKLLRL